MGLSWNILVINTPTNSARTAGLLCYAVVSEHWLKSHWHILATVLGSWALQSSLPGSPFDGVEISTLVRFLQCSNALGGGRSSCSVMLCLLQLVAKWLKQHVREDSNHTTLRSGCFCPSASQITRCFLWSSNLLVLVGVVHCRTQHGIGLGLLTVWSITHCLRILFFFFWTVTFLMLLWFQGL